MSNQIVENPQLYVDLQQNCISEDDLRPVFKDVELLSVDFRRQPTTNTNIAVLHFSSIENAEKAFACYNNIKMESFNRYYLKLFINDPTIPGNEPQTSAFILQVKQLPQNTNNFSLYNLFRQYGPLFSCRIQLQDNKFKGMAFVQFFRQEDADNAMNSLNCKTIEGKTIIVQQHIAKNNTPKIRTNVANHNFIPSAGHTFSPQGSNNNNNNHNHNNNQTTLMSPGPEGPHVDPCNLFIKNLDANIASSDLFNHFRRFGRIISARVMRDQETGNSKGFGFVSYTTADEADKAKSSMHGKTLGTKQIVVRLHEPKKLREAKLANHFSGSPTSPSDSRAPSRRNSDYFNINTVNEYGLDDLNGLAPKARKEVLMSELQKRFKNIPSVPSEEVNPIIEYLLNSKTPEVLQMLKDPTILQQRITDARNIILNRRRGEESNVPTASCSIINSNIINNNINNSLQQQIPQKEKFLKAISRINSRNSAEILDLLMTLGTRERSLCYFNSDYLNKKIIEANGALEAVNNEYETTIPKATMPTETPVSTPPSLKSVEPISIPHSNYTADTPEYKEIEDFMDNLKGKPTNEQKQKLGDRLFPKVKSLGLKSGLASKVTINLLDTDDLRELAHSMNDKVKFDQKVTAATQKVGNSK